MSWLWQSQQPVFESNIYQIPEHNSPCCSWNFLSINGMALLGVELIYGVVLKPREREMLMAWPINQLPACHRSDDRSVNVTTTSRKKLKSCHTTSETASGWSTDKKPRRFGLKSLFQKTQSEASASLRVVPIISIWTPNILSQFYLFTFFLGGPLLVIV